MKSFLLIVLIMTVGASVFAEENAEAKYNQGCRIKIELQGEGGVAPLEVGIDNSTVFSEYNLKKLTDFASHYNYGRWIQWRGLLEIPKDGTYCFSGTIDVDAPKKGRCVQVWLGDDSTLKYKEIFYVGVGLLKELQREGGTDAATNRVFLKKGMVEIMVGFNILKGNWSSDSVENRFTLKYWDVAKPMERKTISPSTLMYPKDCSFPVLTKE